MPDTNTNYQINRDEKYGHSTLIDIPAEVAACELKWLNQTLASVNESVVRLGVFEGTFHWHKHDSEDEFFLVLDGELLIDVEGQETVTLGPHQGYAVPAGVAHRTRASRRTTIVMFEPAGIEPTGDD